MKTAAIGLVGGINEEQQHHDIASVGFRAHPFQNRCQVTLVTSWPTPGRV